MRAAWRSLRHSPGYAAATLATLVLTLGINSAVFSLYAGFLLRPPPYPAPERLFELIAHFEGRSGRTGAAVSEDDDSHDGNTWLAARAAVHAANLAAWGGTSGVNLVEHGESGHAVMYVHEKRVSADYFNVLGIAPARGRAFTADEDRAGGGSAAILSDALWRSAFGGSPNVLGAVIELKGEPYTVVGILPRGAAAPGDAADLYTPLRPAPTGECGGDNCGIVMRLEPGATAAQLAAELGTIPKPTYAAPPIQVRYRAEPLRQYLAGDMASRAEGLLLATLAILLIACANLAGLSLARASRRMPELATRSALGASTGRLVRQLWLESLLLCLAGAAGGWGLAVAVIRAAPHWLPPEQLPQGGLHLDVHVAGFTLAAAFAASALCGLLPALALRGVALRGWLGGTAAGRPGRSHARQGLIAVEAALSVALLAGAGLLARTLIHLENIPAGFDASDVFAATASLSEPRYNDPQTLQQLFSRSLAGLQGVAGVELAAAGSSAPYERGLNYPIRILDGPEAGSGIGSSLAYVTPNYFAVLRIPVLAGRTFTAGDVTGAMPAAVANAAFAKKFYRTRDAVGQHFQIEGVTFTIVGQVGNVAKRPGMGADAPLAAEPVFYLPAAQTPTPVLAAFHLWFQPSWLVRTRGAAPGLGGEVQRALTAADSGLPLSGVYPVAHLRDLELQDQRSEAFLSSALAALALLLAGLGIFALVAHQVAQRARELGVRLALGSPPAAAVAAAAKPGAVAAALGCVAGLGLALYLAPLLRSQLYGVAPYDVATLAGAPLVLLIVAFIAALIPALRVTGLDPAIALRAE